MMRRLRNERGISMLEILIVSGIIGIIAVLAVPTYDSIMTKVRRTRMAAQLRTMAEDQLLYERDHGTYYPALGDSSFALQQYRPEDSMLLEGQDVVLPAGSRHYTYFVYRFEPYYPEPIIFAYAHQVYGNDIDGDTFPDLWIKVGSGRAQVYYDDVTNTIESITLE